MLRDLVGNASFWPNFPVNETRILLRKGFFVWLQALGGVIFGQLDRILLGISLGALVVTPYSLCVQFAHPIFGLSASGLNFVFPYLSSRASTVPTGALRRIVVRAVICNLMIVVCGAVLMLSLGGFLIRLWAGPAVAENASNILPPIVAGSALMGLSVTGTYALQALGDFQTVAGIGLGGRAVMLLLMFEMLRKHGLYGLAVSRLCYGAISLLVYLPLLQKLKSAAGESKRVPPLAVAIETPEVLEP